MTSPYRIPRLAPTVLLTCSLLSAATMLQAQGGPPPGAEQGGGRGPRPGGGRGMMDPIVMEGPPKPEEMATLVTLDQGQQARYTTLYTNLMAGTRQDRDSLRALRAAQRSEDLGAGDRTGRAAFQDLRTDLERQQRGFDAALKDLLSRDQLKQYQHWCDDRRREARDRMRDHRPDGAPPT